MKPTKLKSLLREVDWQNEHGTTETFHKSVYNVGAWVFLLWKRGRINPDGITIAEPKEEV